ncbi:hemolysin III [Nematocida sp. LUAm3]|nr:hemolysin III [Nematocida sp. LUAm3]KAI5174624.1 hemolysin III [Nematocida sp. LUAm2]KAI5177970.1 hemolysin III [Nematocida sp. LUAm1]
MEQLKVQALDNMHTKYIGHNKKEMEEEEIFSSSDYSYSKRGKKPLWRGKIHRVALYMSIALYFMLVTILKTDKVHLTIYFLSQIILYGVSSTYHITEWKDKKSEKLFQKLDHTSIFLLISGTQTCVLTAIGELYTSTRTTLNTITMISYGIAVLGIFKVFFFSWIPRQINVIYYIVHGVSVVVGFPMKCLLREHMIMALCILGGANYIIGGTIYGSKKPNPVPGIFGYHELFHVFTVIGNFCFLLTIVWAAYRKSILQKIID